MTLAEAPVRLTMADIDDLPRDAPPYELVDGQFVEKPMSVLAHWIATEIAHLIREQVLTKTGFLFVEAWAFCFGDDANGRRPDVCFVRAAKYPDGLPRRGHITVAPDLVVEVVSPNDRIETLEERMAQYFDAGVGMIWVVYPDTRLVRVHHADGTITQYTGDAELSAEDVLPGFRCAVSRFFPQKVKEE